MIQTISPVFIISEFDCTNYRQDTKEKKKKRTKMTIKNNEIEKKMSLKGFEQKEQIKKKFQYV